METQDVVIIGAGGAGLMCGREAAKRGLKVLLIDHASILGRKILISGGGRCNFTNLYTEPESYVCQNPHFVKSALARYTPGDFIELVESHKIDYFEKKLGQLFCKESAANIVNMLKLECEKYGAEIRLNTLVESIAIVKNGAIQDNQFKKLSNTESLSLTEYDTGFLVETQNSQIFARSLVVATGGLSVPKVGASGIGYDIAKCFGHKIIPTKPALDGFVFSDSDKQKYDHLYGISCDVNLKANQSSFRENILFTHLGLSGPASLQGSLYWESGDHIEIDFCPDFNVEEELLSLRDSGGKKNVRVVIRDWLPKRLADKLTGLIDTDTKIAELSNQKLALLVQFLKGHRLKPVSTVGFIKAEVTKGGIDTAELSSKTMESKKVKNLYFIGEVVDVTGQLGGYNFQWAWASGHVAGQSVG